jgi:hypothetical protein
MTAMVRMEYIDSITEVYLGSVSAGPVAHFLDKELLYELAYVLEQRIMCAPGWVSTHTPPFVSFLMASLEYPQYETCGSESLTRV